MKLSYKRELFVDREEECALVAGVARQVIEGAGERPRVLAFYGERGSGKTWLALHLKHNVLAGIAGVSSLLLRFSWSDEDGEPSKQSKSASGVWLAPGKQEADAKVRELMIWIAEQIGATTGQKLDLETLAGWLVRDISSKYTAGRLLVLILDSLFEEDRAFLDKLESALLAPLVTLPNILIVMTGRGPLPSWTSPYLRPNSDTLRRLETFNEDEVRKQIAGQSPNFQGDVKEIHELSGGYPYCVYLLSQGSDRGRALELAVQSLLSVIASERERIEAQRAFEALCVLNGFREFEIQRMAAIHDGDELGDLDIAEARRLRDLMRSTHLLRWEDGRFVIDGAVAQIFRSYLRIKKHELYKRLHDRAFRMYEQMAAGFSDGDDARAHYLKLAKMHKEALHAEGVDPDDFCRLQEVKNNSPLMVPELAQV